MKEFTLKSTSRGDIHGYEWPVDNPEKTICIVHGIGEYGERYDRVARKFNEAGFAVFSMDLRGHGTSLGKRGDCAPREEVLEDVSALVSRALRTYPNCKLLFYGHSMGGNITLDYRRRGAFRDLPAAYLLSAPWIRLKRPIPTALYYLAKMASNLAPTFTIGSNVDEMNLGNPASILPYHEDPLVHNRISLRCAMDGFRIANELERGKNTEGIAKDIPVMIMHGCEDRICDIEGSRKFCDSSRKRGENVEMKELPGIFHEIHNGGSESCGDEVIDMIIDYFRSIG